MKKAFSLIELSIVIVIIGLLISAISVTTNITNDLKLKKVIKDMNDVVLALKQFRLIYNDLPGDIPNAYDYWGSAFSCTNAVATVNSTGCNGDGDGLVNNTSAGNRHEGYRAWQQLGHLDLIRGDYTGQYSSGFNCTPGTNTFETAMQGLAISFSTGRNLLLGGTVSNDNCWGGGISPVDAQYIDRKIDNGISSTGFITAANGSGKSNCVDGSGYKSNTTLECRVFYIDAYDE